MHVFNVFVKFSERVRLRQLRYIFSWLSWTFDLW